MDTASGRCPALCYWWPAQSNDPKSPGRTTCCFLDWLLADRCKSWKGEGSRGWKWEILWQQTTLVTGGVGKRRTHSIFESISSLHTKISWISSMTLSFPQPFVAPWCRKSSPWSTWTINAVSFTWCDLQVLQARVQVGFDCVSHQHLTQRTTAD